MLGELHSNACEVKVWNEFDTMVESWKASVDRLIDGDTLTTIPCSSTDEADCD